MSKTVKIILIAVVLIPVVLITLIATLGGRIVTEAVNSYGPDLLGVGIELEGVDFSLLSGEIEINGLTIRNPEGFESDYAIQLASARIALSPLSIFSDKIEISEIVVEAPDIILELGSGGNNLRVLEANAVAGSEGSDGEDVSDEGAAVVIDDLWIRNASFTLAGLPAGISSPEIRLPDIHMENIGAEDEGAPLDETVAEIISLLATTAVTAASNADIEGLAAVREQLWAEAKHRYQANEHWWIKPGEELASVIEAQQERRYDEDPIEQVVRHYITHRPVAGRELRDGGEITGWTARDESGKFNRRRQSNFCGHSIISLAKLRRYVVL